MSRQGAVAQNVNIVDIISEGPIKGLVGGLSGIYLDDVPVEEAKFSATTGSQEDNAPVTATITFNGTHTGTVSENVDLAGVDKTSVKSLTLLEYYTTNCRITNISKTDESTVATLSTAPASVWTDDWNSGQTERANASGDNAVFLYKDDVIIFGNFKISNGKNGNFTVLSDYVLEDGEEYTLVVHQTRQIKTIDGNAGTIKVKGARVGGPAPNSGAYNFILNGSIVYDEDGSTVVLNSTIKKINKLNVDFRNGELNQLPVSSVGGVGAAVGVTGNTGSISGPQELKMINETLAANLGFTLFNIEGLPNTDPNSDNYPGLPDKSSLSTTATVLPAAAFGLDTGAKIREVDQVIFGITYGAFQTLNLEGGDKETAYAFYQMHIRFEQDSTYGPWYKLFGNSDTLVRHRGRTDAPVEFDHVVNIEGFRRALGQFTDFQVRICRVSRHIGMGVNYDGTPGSRTNKGKWQVQAKASVNRLSATIKDYFSYPYSSLASLSFSSRQFDGIPKRSYLLKGKLVKVPTTYTPREYSDTGIAKYAEFWDGNFQETPLYTDNPAWVFYDIVTNNRYGAGKWIKEEDIDKYALYRIARYCDELVDDGNEYDSTKSLKRGNFYKIHSAGDTNWSAVGADSSVVGTIFQATDTTFGGTGILYGVEPRFRANIFLTKATEAYKVLKDFATVFLGILYAQDSKITAVQDAPQDPVYTFTKGNVIDGVFTYESTGSRTRTNQCVVTWNDPTINYEPVPLVVEDRESIVRTGRIISENVVAFGATSESQAIRYGKWKLWTAQNQTEMVSFKTSLAAYYVKPGDVINVQDADRFGISYSGRTSSATSTTLTFDRNVSFNSGSTYELSTLVTAPAALSAASSSITINDTNGNGTTYAQGEKIDYAWVYSDTDNPADGDRDSYVYTALDTEEKASNAFLDSTGSELIPIIWKPYSYVETHEITNPGNTSNSVTLANSATFDTTPSKHNIWALKETSGGVNTAASKKMYKILSISEESPNTFAIAAVEYFDEKYTAVEGEYELGTLPESVFIQNEPVDLPRPINPRIILASDRRNAGEELVLEWENPGTDAIVSYEVAHNIADLESPILTDDTNVKLNSIPNGGLLFRIRAVSRKGNKSSPTTISYEVYDVFDENVPRMKQGIAKGAVSTAQGRINSSNEFVFQATNTSIASVTNPFITYTITGAKSVANISTNKEYYLYLDTATPSLKLLEFDNSALNNMQFYRDVGSGNTAISAAWTSIGTVSIEADSNEVTGSGFNTNVELRDTLNLSNSTSPSGGDGARVVSIISDTRLLIDRTFDTAKTDITGYRSTFRPDYANDCIFAEITKTGSTISTNNFITLRSASDDTEGTTETLDDGTIAVKDGGISVDKIAANSITADKIQANTITADQIAANSISANEIAANSITADMITSNSVVSSLITASTIQSSHIKSNSIVSTIIDATTITANNITATNLSALSADLGAVTAGTMQGGTIPDADAAPSGTESGAFLNLTGGKMVFGNSSKYILFDGSDLELNGVTIDASSTINATAAADITVKEDGTSAGTGIASFNFTTGLGLSVSGTEATITVDSQTDNNFTNTLKTKLDNIEVNADVTDTANVVAALSAGTNITIAADGTISSSNQTLTTEEVQDIVGGMVSGNTESGITVTYDDAGNSLDFSVASQTDNNFTNTLKTKLDNIDENANAFTLSPATATTLGGVKIGSGININSGVISAATQSDENFTSTLKTKLDNIEENANEYTLPTASSSELGGVKIGAGINIDNTGAITASTQSDENFTSALKTKLEGIDTNANNYTLPEATSTVLGGVKDGARVTIDANGVLSADVQTANDFTNALKNKLDNIEENANAFTLSPATASTLGGVKIGSGISISSGTISADTQSDENFTSTLKTKLDNIEANATADQSASEIRTLLGTATSSTSGLVKIGFTETGKNYPVELSSGQMFVNVPWTDNNTTYTNGDGLSLSGSNEFSVNNTVVRTTGAQTIAGNKTFSNNVIVSGDLTVSGTTTYINTTNLNIGDSVITLNADFTGTTATENAGIEVERGDESNVTLLWTESGIGEPNDYTEGWTFGSARVAAGTFYGNFIGSVTGSPSSLSGLSTDDLAEGSQNLYFTTARARSSLSQASGGGITYDSSNGEISVDSTVVRTTGAQTLAGAKTFSNGIVASGGISGLTLTNGISGTNFNITGVNQISINDPGEGILFTAGSSGNMHLAIVDDASDNILRYSGTNAVFDVQGNITLSGTVDGRDLATDGAKLDNIAANATNTAAPAITTDGSTPSLASGITAAEVRSLIQAGTSSLTLGTTSTTALRGDTAIPTVNNPAITLDAGNAGITMDSDNSFTLNQAGAETITISHAATSSQESVTNNNGTVIQDITLDTFGHITGIDSIDLDGRYFTETESDARYLRKDSYNSNWTRLGYGTSGTAYWHKLAEVTINGSYKDYQLRCDWTDRYNHGTLNIHIHSDNDNTADIWDAYVQQFGKTNRKASSHFKYYKSGSTVQVWIYTPGWREWDYIRTDAVTEGTPTIVWYKEGDSGVGKTTTEPSNLEEFDDYTPWHPNNDGTGSGLDADLLDSNNSSYYLDYNNFTNTPTIPTNTNFYLDGISKSGNTLTFSVNGATDQTYTFGSNAFTSTTIPTDNNQIGNGAGYITGISSSDVTGALGFTPYNSTNPSGYITGISGSDVTTALGFTPYNSTNPSGYITNSTASLSGDKITSGTINNARLSTDMQLTANAPRYRLQESGVTNTPNWWMIADGGNYSIRLNNTGAYPLTIQTNSTNNAVTSVNIGYSMSVSGNISVTGTVDGRDVAADGAKAVTAHGWGNHASAGYLTGITSSQVTTALGFTPYNATNPAGYLTSSSNLNASNLSSGTVPAARLPDNIFDSYRRDTIDSASEDFNSYTTTGTYHVNNWSESGDVVSNGPTGSYPWGMLRVTNWQDADGSGSTYVLQEYFPHNTDHCFHRIMWNGTFTGWRESWGSGSDGSGSGLDADKLDGQEGSYYRSASNINAGTLNAARLADSGVTATSYTNANITVDAKGRVTAASSGSAGGITSITVGDGLDITTGNTPEITLDLNELTDATVAASNDHMVIVKSNGATRKMLFSEFIGDQDIVTGNVTGTLFADIIVANSIETDMLKANTITADKIAANLITADKIAAASITAEQLQISNNASGSAGIYMDYNSGNSRIDIRDSSALRVRIGYLA